VRFLGFAPGFAYLGPLDPSLVLARRADPRPRVPAGSVAVAGDQTAIYPLDTPGGWHLIGRTDVLVFDPARDPPSLLAPGDRVRFQPAVS
jgi:KipI family sensor histidine kinase inhibitor